MCDMTNPIFHNETKARAHLEALRWTDGRYCPHCGEAEQTSPVKGKSHRPGLYYCLSCKGQFTVTVGTLLERSKVPLHKWALAFHLMAASKKGVSAHQLHRMLGVTYKTAWFMAHRIREAMYNDYPTPMGGPGSKIEIDETYIGGKKRGKNQWGVQYGIEDKMKVVSLVERGGTVRSFHVDRVNSRIVREILVRNASRESDLRTDEAKFYRSVGKEFASHERVHHAIKEYVRGDAHTNTIEGYFSIFKRGIKGIYQHCSERHLHRYLAEFDFRYNQRSRFKISDSERAAKALKGITGKRLTYRRTSSWV